MTDESTPDSTQPSPPPIETMEQGSGSSVDEVIAQAVSKIEGAEGGVDESSITPEASEESVLPSPDTSSEIPDSEPAPDAGLSDSPDPAETQESGDSPFFTHGDQGFSQDDLGGLVDAHSNREAFQQAAQEQADKLRQQVQSLEVAKQQLDAERALMAKQKTENEAYGNYIRWMQEGGSGDIAEYAQVSGQKSILPQQPGQQDPPESQEARIERVLQKVLGKQQTQSRQQTIETGFDGWVSDIVSSEPSLKGREHAYGSSITQRFVEECQRQRVQPTQFTDTQIKGFLREYAREAAQVERKISETTMADRLDRAAKTKETLPAAPRTQGTPLPTQPKGFKLDFQKMAQESGGDMDAYFEKLGSGLKEQADELSSMANRL